MAVGSTFFGGHHYYRVKGSTYNFLPISDWLDIKLFSNFGIIGGSKLLLN